MRNLIILFQKNHLLILFIVLESICALQIVQNNKYHKSAFLNSSSSLAGNIYETRDDISEYFSLKEVNDELLQENARLRSLVPNKYSSYGRRSYIIRDSVFKQQYLYKPARVINSTTHLSKNYITLNVGSINGIEQDMGVIGPNGVVGIVKDISDNYCSVLSVLNEKIQIPVKLKETNDPGSLRWDKDNCTPDVALVKGVSSHVLLKEGDEFITSGASAIFPEGISVGKIQVIDKEQGQSFYTLTIKLSSDFKKIDAVYVVTNMLKAEQLKLEAKAAEDD